MSKAKQNLIQHVVINLGLLAILVVTIAGCGFFNSVEAVTAFKSYKGVIYAGNDKSGKVALMINVYWGTEYLSTMLDTLKAEDVKCTFFVGKTWVQENPDLLKRIFNEGHEIGNHGSNHLEHARLSYEQNVSEINGCHDEVFEAVGVKMNLFAPPSGNYNETTVKAASDLGYKTILWTHDTIDWRDQDTNLIFKRATEETISGDLILMHPTKCTMEALEDIIKAIKSKKLALSTVSDTIKD